MSDAGTKTEAPDALGGRLKLLAPSELSPDQKRTYDVIDTEMVPWAESAGFQSKTDDGRLIGPFNSVLYSPKISAAFLALQAAEQKNTTLDDRVRQVVILTVGAVWGCDYERYAHAAVARKAGIRTRRSPPWRRAIRPTGSAARSGWRSGSPTRSPPITGSTTRCTTRRKRRSGRGAWSTCCTWPAATTRSRRC